MAESLIGRPIDRKDGIAKVTGRATYVAEHRIDGVAYAMSVQSTIAQGAIVSITHPDLKEISGLLYILTHQNAPRLLPAGDYEQGGEPGEQLQPLQDAIVHYSGQHVALAVAETLESAQEAASRIKVRYVTEQPAVEMATALDDAYAPEKFFGSKIQFSRGDCNTALRTAPVRIEQTYTTPTTHHNPIEPHATIARWDGDELTLYETTQWVLGVRSVAAKSFGIPPEKVHVISPFVGGGFGCKGFVWPHTLLAAMASRAAGRPVKLVLEREQMFSTVGRRGRTEQTITLAADHSGKLLGIRHATLTETSQVGHFMEPCGKLTSVLYACPNAEITHRVVRLNLGTPTSTRAPGESTGSFAIESAMDELAFNLNIDPIELRVRNHAGRDPESGKPFSSKHLIECYERGARAFGWSKRDPRPSSMREGGFLIGWGMATACYPANRRPASARVTISADGSVLVTAATHDLGTGTYTILAQIAADVLELPLDRVRCDIGDSALPRAPVSGGSSTTASVGQAVYLAAVDARDQLARLPPRIASDRRTVLAARLRNAGLTEIIGNSETQPAGTDAQNPILQIVKGRDGKPEEPFSLHSFGAQLVEVRVERATGSIRVSRVVSVHDVGRIANHKTATSQIRGGVVWGIGMGLLERTAIDPKSGRVVTRNLADYLIPVHADIPEIEVELLNKPDPHINALGMRGIGEIGITGVAAAIANAVFHATGKRVRDLPITLDRLM
jgi:xanthine dehydrogenase YagR molybdenum-binding subunit